MKGLNIELLRTIDFLTLAYVGILSILIAIFHEGLKQWGIYLLAHALYVVVVIILISWAAKSKHKAIHFLRDAYALISVSFFYEELEGLIHIIFTKSFDHLVNGLELAIFGTYPTVWLQNMMRPWLTEFFVYSYFSYYFMIIIPALVLCISGRRQEFHEFSINVMLAYYISFIIFVLFPVEGPRFVLAPLHATPLKGYAFSQIHAYFMDMGAYRGGAMPSSHIAATVVSLVMMRRYEKRIYYPMFPLVIFMIFSTIYGRYHYVSDAVAGILVGWLSLALISQIRKKKPLSEEPL